MKRVILLPPLLVFLVVLLAVLGFLSLLVLAIPQAGLNLLFGWIPFLLRVVPQLTVNWEGVATAAVCLVGLFFGLHRFLGWIARARKGASETAVWKLRWTACILGMVVLLFVAGIAAVGLTHQTAWLADSPVPLLHRPWAFKRISSSNNLTQIGRACRWHEEEKGTLPAGGTFDRHGRMLHGWQTALLPYVEQHNLYKRIDLARPWDHPDNRPWFRSRVRTYLIWDVGPEEEDGFALSHYAGNVHVLGGDRPRTLAEIDRGSGTANTILAGEAAGHFKPWGYPANWRDPAHGLNRTPDGFGQPSGRPGYTQFLFADGSVRGFDSDAAPEFLEALARTRRDR